MDITKDNFLSNLGNILFLIARSDYVAVDLELTGISTTSRNSRHGSFESMEEVYGSARQAASTFQTVQLGLTFVCFVTDNTQTDASGECHGHPGLLSSSSNVIRRVQGIHSVCPHQFNVQAQRLCFSEDGRDYRPPDLFVMRLNAHA